ncbi:hypothetical protein GW17_00015211 [Ensete ventricosum]|nr:hypothetical protein GW17_00015211 [Ensete ventricosum]
MVKIRVYRPVQIGFRSLLHGIDLVPPDIGSTDLYHLVVGSPRIDTYRVVLIGGRSIRHHVANHELKKLKWPIKQSNQRQNTIVHDNSKPRHREGHFDQVGINEQPIGQHLTLHDLYADTVAPLDSALPAMSERDSSDQSNKAINDRTPLTKKRDMVQKLMSSQFG